MRAGGHERPCQLLHVAPHRRRWRLGLDDRHQILVVEAETEADAVITTGQMEAKPQA